MICGTVILSVSKGSNTKKKVSWVQRMASKLLRYSYLLTKYPDYGAMDNTTLSYGTTSLSYIRYHHFMTQMRGKTALHTCLLDLFSPDFISSGPLALLPNPNGEK